MRRFYKILLLLFLPLLTFAKDGSTLNGGKLVNDLRFSGQLSGWLQYSPDIERNVGLGGRYIPQLNYRIPLSEKRSQLIDFEASAIIYGDMGSRMLSNVDFSGKIKPYRIWMRYSTRRTELRLGLQKINFGSAVMFRPLMWFDHIDPRDPLQLTEGVYGMLFRYYFQNNANLWFWGLYGNNQTKGYETLSVDNRYPEGGMRAQLPIKQGEIAGSYHFRMANTKLLSDYGIPIVYGEIGEHKIGFDLKLDVIVGLWLEASWTTFNRDLDIYTNQEMITLGVDYTIGAGNGINVIFEQMIYSNDRSPFKFSNPSTFSGLSLSYPLGIFDKISSMIYYDWKNSKTYTFLSWQKELNSLTFHLIGYWNPKQYLFPGQVNGNTFAGKGIQAMVVWNY